jgi:hypothetical protein
VRGDTLVVSGNTDGAAYVYWNDHGYWRSEQKLSNVGNASNGFAGVAIHGRHIIVGAPGEDVVPHPDWDGDPSFPSVDASGAVYVFTKSQGRWRQTQRIRPDYNAPEVGNFIGLGATLAAAGERVAIGAPGSFDNNNGQYGQTYVYRWDGDTLVFDLHLSETGSTLSMTPRRLAIGISTNDSHGNSVEGAVAIDFGDRDPSDEEDD